MPKHSSVYMLVDKFEGKPIVINSQMPIFWGKARALDRAKAGGYDVVRLPQDMFNLNTKEMEKLGNGVLWDPKMFE